MSEDPAATDIPALKRALRGRISDLAAVWRDLESETSREAAAIREVAAAGRSPVPVLQFADIAAGLVAPAEMDAVRRRGAALVRGTVPAELARRWDEELAGYLTANDYAGQSGDAGLGTYFGGLGAKTPQIFAVYWSRPQLEARQHPSMAVVRRFMNRLWRFCDGEGATATRWFFDPDREVTYADRVRRRQPGDTTLGLSPHMDGGSVERWLDPGYRAVYRHIFDGDWRAHDPFDGEFRVEAREFPAPNTSTFFRSYQGWLALTAQGPGDGTLQLVPMVRHSTAYLLLRPLLADVPEELLCGAALGRAQAILPEWHQPLLDAVVPIPRAEPGDTVWWHPDCIHAVEAEHRGKGYSDVIFIPGGPLCEKNAAYAARQRAAFATGRTPPDFAPEDRETGYRGRGGVPDLTPLGHRQLGLEPWPDEGDGGGRAALLARCAAAAAAGTQP
jgi:hypothetical protein